MKSVIERSFELAPECRELKELQQRLRGEGYTQIKEHFVGLGIRRQLAEHYNDGAGAKKRGPRRTA